MTRLGAAGRMTLDVVGYAAAGRMTLDVVGYAAAAVLAAASWLRGGKVVHPHGAAHAARLSVTGVPFAPAAARLLSTGEEYRAIVRFSRSLGLPRPLPDLIGMSVRVLDAYGPGRHQDFLLVSSVDRPVLHHLIVPAADVQQRVYSSLLPYRAGADTFLVGAAADPRSPRPDGDDELDRLARAAATGRLAFALAVAPVGGRFRPVATLRVGERLPDHVDALRFNPFNCGGGLRPAGVLNRLRDYAYPLSQSAWTRRAAHRRIAALADAEAARLSAGPRAR